MTPRLQISRVGKQVILTVSEPDEAAALVRYLDICGSSPFWLGMIAPKRAQDKCRIEASTDSVVMFVEAA